VTYNANLLRNLSFQNIFFRPGAEKATISAIAKDCVAVGNTQNIKEEQIGKV